ncbi:MAG: bifunctional demethylmenaquinone methyltransferase/2-methoxy-6-polyprenyl-1,4-benzoquinol methylase UbiE [Fimbriimonadaceae bacterium]|nr:bifunctional demethylmenaquinone methyltransferase/2-methoxy-6-polyprenyl-1,4-benzoquinol methylase UbiE [Alphaproteobacteria bacterium]
MENRQKADNARHFGFRDVEAGKKQGLVDQVFARVASRYDLMNDLMSGGLHRLWKDAAIAWLAPPRNANRYRLIDVAGGTGDIALRVLDAAGPGAKVDVCDINNDMLREGRAKAEKLGRSEEIRFTQGNAESLPFGDCLFDAYTIAFGLRNVPDIEAALSEAYRVLKPGGRFLCLEFSEVDMPVLDRIYDFYSFNAIPVMGGLVAGDADSYRYLVESIRQFPDQKKLAQLVADAGFGRVKYRNLSGGIAAIHSGWRI